MTDYEALAKQFGGAVVDPSGQDLEALAAQFGGKAEAPRRSMLEELARQAGLTLRYGAEGAIGIAAPFIDPFQKLAGGTTISQATSNVLTSLGVPQPETGAEQLSGAISRGVAGGGGMAKLAGAIPRAAGATPELVNNLLAQKPLMQAAQAGIGGGAAEATRQVGGGPTAQLIAGAITPMATTTAANVAGAAARGARELVRPVTQKGAEQIAADVIGNLASDKEAALRNLDRYLAMQKLGQQTGRNVLGVAGSKPTSGAVTADYGLIGAEQLAARGTANPDFAMRFAKNNQARLEELAKLRATERQLAQYVERRDKVTAALREQAFANAKGAVDFNPVAQKIGALVATPEGGRIESEKALRWLAGRLEKYTEEGRVSPQNAYALRQDISDLVAGKVREENGGALRLAGGIANEVKKTLTDQIEQAAPAFKKYLETYARMSKPIERLEKITAALGGENLDKVTNALPMATPEGAAFALSQAKMRNAAKGIDANVPVSPRGLPLAPYQRDVLGRVMGDLNSQELALRGGKMPGSDTYQNMATANLLRNVLGSNLAQAGAAVTAARPLNFAFKALEPRVQDIVAKAFLDPEKMAELLRKSRTNRVSPTITEFFGPQYTLGGLLAGAM